MDAPVCPNQFHRPSKSSLEDLPLTSNLHKLEITGKEEEHRQLPPDENVPQGRWPAQEGWCSGLNVLITDGLSSVLHRGLSNRSELSIWSYWVSFDIHLFPFLEDLPSWGGYHVNSYGYGMLVGLLAHLYSI
jgi:hypothetical protein